MGNTPRREASPHTPARTKVVGGVIVAAVVSLLAALVPMFMQPATAASVTPTFVTGNASCGQLGFLHEVKFNGVPANGPHNITVDGVNGVITISNSTNFSFSFTSTIGVSAVFVKAANGGNLFVYDPPAPTFGDTNLFSPPTNPGGPQAQISHVSFCFGEPGQSFDELTINKTAVPTYSRDFDWTIDKSVDPASVTTAANTATFHYTVQVNKGPAQDTGHAVTGTIDIANVNPVAVTITGVTDAIEGNPAAAACVLLDAVPASIAANSVVQIDYSCTFASAAAALATDSNTATVSWTDPGTGAALSASDIESYTWPDPPATVTDDSVTVDDAFNGQLPVGLVPGTISASHTYNYDRTVAVPASGCFTYDNTATVHETEGDSSDSASVVVCRATNDGFTRGFWTNKNGAKWINANLGAVQGMINTYSNVLAGVPATAAGIKATIEGSNSSGDAFTQFRAQFLATALSVLKSPGGALGNQFVSGPGGACKSITQWLVYGNANYGGALLDTKAELIALKDLYDAVNNNVAPLCVP